MKVERLKAKIQARKRDPGTTRFKSPSDKIVRAGESPCHHTALQWRSQGKRMPNYLGVAYNLAVIACPVLLGDYYVDNRTADNKA